MKLDNPNQTRCPLCKANLWVYPDRGPVIKCQCGHHFEPEVLTRYVTGDEKRKRQDDLA